MTNVKISELPAVTSVSDDDLLVFVDDPTGTPATKSIAVDDLKASLNYISSADATELTDGSTTTLHTHAITVASGIELTAAPSSDTTGNGVKITLTAGEALAFGNACYIHTDGTALKADASAIASSSAILMALESISSSSTGDFLLIGIARNDAWNWTVGGLIYLSETAGALTQTAPTTTDSVTQVLGVATHADRMFWNPQLTQVEHT
jgi:hypothetical protein